MPPAPPPRNPAARTAHKNREAPGDELARIARAAALLRYASDPARLRVLLLLRDGERNVGDLCGELGVSHAAFNRLVGMMRLGGVLTPRRQGTKVFYSLTEQGEALARAAATLT